MGMTMHRLVQFLAPAAVIGSLGLFSAGCTGGDKGGSDSGPLPDVLTGTLGDLGTLAPIVSGNVIEYSGETITYLSTVDLPCSAMAESRWLGNLDPSAQIIEIVYKSATTGTHFEVGGTGELEVHYAKGGRSSSYEENASTGAADIADRGSGDPISGTVDAVFKNPAGSLAGPFSAEFCAGGQEY